MELEHSFTVPVPEERAWEVLLDVERVAPCMPGATLDSVDGDEIKGRIKVKVGPIAMTYAGTARFTERDPEAHVITLEASGKETRGAGTASATVRSMLEGQDGQTHVIVHTTLNVTGRPAQFGRGVMAEVGGKLIGIFASNLADMLAAQPAQPGRPRPRRRRGRGPGQQDDQEERPGQSIESLNLSLRSYNSLRREGIHTVGDLAARTREDLLAIDEHRPGVGGGDPAEARRPGAGPQRLRARRQRHRRPARGRRGRRGQRGERVGSRPGRREHGLVESPDDDAIDLLSVAGGPMLKRVIPVAAVVVVGAVIVLGIRGRRRRSRG